MKLTEEQCQMIEDNIKLAYKYAHKFKDKYINIPLQDLDDICIDGLIDAVQTHDPSKGALSTHTFWACRKRMLYHFREMKCKTVPLEGISEESEDFKYINKIGDCDHYSFIERDEVAFYTNGLTDTEKDLINRYYYLRQTQSAIGKVINKDQGTTGFLIRRAVEKMRKKYKAIEGC